MLPALVACATVQVVNSFQVYGAQPIEPDPKWEIEAEWVRSCTGSPVELDEIRWERADSVKHNGLYYGGLYTWRPLSRDTKTITLVSTGSGMVRHELLHAAGLDHYDEEFRRCLVRR